MKIAEMLSRKSRNSLSQQPDWRLIQGQVPRLVQSRVSRRRFYETAWRCCQSNRYKSLFAAGWPSLDLRRDMLPLDHGSRPSDLVVVAADKVTFLVEVIVEGGMDGAKLLQRLHLSEPEHGSLSPSERLVRVLGQVVRIAADLLAVSDAEFLHRGTV